jgi:O-antigen/teichoic acid export membrane protein
MRAALFFNYTVQLYSAFAILLVVPFYITSLGPEGYGLVAFFIMLQAWSQILEAGVSGSVTRLIAVSKSDYLSFIRSLNQLFKITLIFLVVSIAIILTGVYCKELIAVNWLTTTINPSIVVVSVMAMFLSLSFKYLSGPSRSALVGLERHVEISIIAMVVLTLKFPLSVLFISYCSDSLDDFFIYQAVVSAFELFFFVVVSLYRIGEQKKVLHGQANVSKSNIHSFADFLRFSLLLSLLSISWVVVTQVDKLVLSKFLTLSDYGYYSLAVSLSGAILLLSAPLNQMLMPRLTDLFNTRNDISFYRVFFSSFIVVTLLSFSLSLFLLFFGYETIYVWTGDLVVSEKANIYLGLLSAGNSISVLMSMVFMLLFAKGDLKNHTIVYIFYSLILIPLSIIVAYKFGGYGASMFWLIHNLVLFFSWGCWVIEKNFHNSLRFIFYDLFLPCLIISVTNFSLWSAFFRLPKERVLLLVCLFLIGFLNVCILAGYFIGLNSRSRAILFGIAKRNDSSRIRLHNNG